jgi:alkylhydroperoxidase/carboxymuconolactone decarboxylase family protein YurZ
MKMNSSKHNSGGKGMAVPREPKNKTSKSVSKSTKNEGVIGYLPEVYSDFTRDYPEISQAYAALAESCHNAGPLDKKTSRLVQLGIAIGINSEGGVRSHARRALEEGISAEEVRHAVLLSLTTAGFHYMMAAHKWVEEVLEKAR